MRSTNDQSTVTIQKDSHNVLTAKEEKSRSIDFITSMSAEYYEKIGYRLTKTFDHYFPENIKLHIWSEDTLPVDSNRFIFHDLQTNEFYNRFTMQVKKPNKTSKMSIKVGAQYEASKILTGNTLVWLDADVFIIKPIDHTFFNKVTPHGLAKYMGQHYDSGPETGFISYNRTHSEFINFMEQFVDIYYSGRIYDINPSVDTGAWWTVKQSMPEEFFHSLSSHLGVSHVFSGSELREYLGHAKGAIKSTKPDLCDNRAFVNIEN